MNAAATALESRIATMTERQTVDGLNMLKDMYGTLDKGNQWPSEANMVRAELLMALEDVHGWSEYQAELFEARLFWDSETVANIEAMNAAGIYG
jgi:hypothetical protein